MADDAVPLHFTKSQASVSRSPFHGLPGEDLHRTPPSGVDFVVYHVLQALVVGGIQEDLGLQLAACMAIVHNLHQATLP